MPYMKAIRMTDFRCFGGEHLVGIRPLTLISGDYNTGKTTILGAVKAAASLVNADIHSGLDFETFYPHTNDVQYLCTNGGNEFGLGVEVEGLEGVTGVFARLGSDYGGSAAINEVHFTVEPHFFVSVTLVDMGLDQQPGLTAIVTEYDSDNRHFYCEADYLTFHRMSQYGNIAVTTMAMLQADLQVHQNKNSNGYLLDTMQDAIPIYQKMAHIKAGITVDYMEGTLEQPTREYTETPQNSEQIQASPVAFRALSRKKPEDWDNVRTSINKFGKSSGLFSDMRINNSGTGKTDPFGMEFKINGRWCNYADAGHSIAHILPILEVILNPSAPENTHFLLPNLDTIASTSAVEQLVPIFNEVIAAGQRIIAEIRNQSTLSEIRRQAKAGIIDKRDVLIVELKYSKSKLSITHKSVDGRQIQPAKLLK